VTGSTVALDQRALISTLASLAEAINATNQGLLRVIAKEPQSAADHVELALDALRRTQIAFEQLCESTVANDF
jgi:hypothetical protein